MMIPTTTTPTLTTTTTTTEATATTTTTPTTTEATIINLAGKNDNELLLMIRDQVQRIIVGELKSSYMDSSPLPTGTNASSNASPTSTNLNAPFTIKTSS